MEVLKSVYGFLTDTLYLDAILAVLGGLSVLSKATKTKLDDKVIGLILLPFTHVKKLLTSK